MGPHSTIPTINGLQYSSSSLVRFVFCANQSIPEDENPYSISFLQLCCSICPEPFGWWPREASWSSWPRGRPAKSWRTPTKSERVSSKHFRYGSSMYRKGTFSSIAGLTNSLPVNMKIILASKSLSKPFWRAFVLHFHWIWIVQSWRPMWILFFLTYFNFILPNQSNVEETWN